jgi:hypothetical protein
MVLAAGFASVAILTSPVVAQTLSGKTTYTNRGAATFHSNGDYSWKGKKVGKWKQTGSKVCITYPDYPLRCITYDFKTMTGTNHTQGGTFRFWF